MDVLRGPAAQLLSRPTASRSRQLRDDRRTADAGGLVACTGAVEIAVHGWDVTAALARAGCAGGGGNSGEPIPAALATRLLRVCPR